MFAFNNKLNFLDKMCNSFWRSIFMYKWFFWRYSVQFEIIYICDMTSKIAFRV